MHKCTYCKLENNFRKRRETKIFFDADSKALEIGGKDSAAAALYTAERKRPPWAGRCLGKFSPLGNLSRTDWQDQR